MDFSPATFPGDSLGQARLRKHITFSCSPECLDGPPDLLQLVSKVACLPEGLRASVIASLLEGGIVLVGRLSELQQRHQNQISTSINEYSPVSKLYLATNRSKGNGNIHRWLSLTRIHQRYDHEAVHIHGCYGSSSSAKASASTF